MNRTGLGPSHTNKENDNSFNQSSFKTEVFVFQTGMTQTFTTQSEYSNMNIFRNGVLLVDPAQYNLYPTSKYVEVLDNLSNNEIITLKYTAE